jgi:hypothetical protein
MPCLFIDIDLKVNKDLEVTTDLDITETVQKKMISFINFQEKQDCFQSFIEPKSSF